MKKRVFFAPALFICVMSASVASSAFAASKQANGMRQSLTEKSQKATEKTTITGNIYAQNMENTNSAGSVAYTPAAREAELKYSITTTFPGGGSQPIANAVGVRRMLDTQKAISLALLFSNNTNNEKDKSIFGVSGKFQYFTNASVARAKAYGFGGAYIWKPGGDANKPNDNTAFGLSGGIGAEVYFIPEFSSFVETGIFIDASNRDEAETEFGTFASAIGLSYNFDI